jgi:sulfite reductase (NADPH) hemoprotein beta-component
VLPGGDFALWQTPNRYRSPKQSSRFDDLTICTTSASSTQHLAAERCGHHHGHIGILGVDKNGAEWYQVRSAARRATTQRLK